MGHKTVEVSSEQKRVVNRGPAVGTLQEAAAELLEVARIVQAGP